MMNFGFFSIIPLIYLAILVFIIYFMVQALKFMNEKKSLDQQRNEKLAELIQAVRNNKQE